MSKLIPISSNQMKAMGIVKSKNGFLMRDSKPASKKEVKSDNKKEASRKESNRKEVREESRQEVRQVKQSQPQPVVVVQKNEKQIERKRLEDRGIYR